jgi:hypothetical protein
MGRRVGRVKERERRNKLAVAPMSDHGNRRDWLKFDHGPREVRSPVDLTHSSLFLSTSRRDTRPILRQPSAMKEAHVANQSSRLHLSLTLCSILSYPQIFRATQMGRALRGSSGPVFPVIVSSDLLPKCSCGLAGMLFNIFHAGHTVLPD